MTPTLHAYRHARVIVQNVHTSAAHAALAMRTNDVGCVLVSDGRQVVGIVTDRDLALRVVAEGRSALETEVGAVMSSPLAVLDVDAPHDEAIRIMREWNIRRVPLTRGTRIVGVVTLDDLVLERSATLEDVASVVRGQIVEGGPARTRRYDEWTALGRRHARALGTKAKLLARIRSGAALASNREAETAAIIVLEALVHGLDDPLARELVARLPVAFRGRLAEGMAASRGAVGSRAECERRIARDLALDRATAAAVVRSVGAALSDIVRASDPVGRRLPPALRAILHDASPRDAPRARASRVEPAPPKPTRRSVGRHDGGRARASAVR